jgi:DNA-binding GntR family transcriptional regulator
MKEKKSMEQVVYDTLTDAIISRKIAPGTQLIETMISEQLKVSRTPIRNAIKRLEVDGFVNLIPNRGAFVIRPSIDEMVQAFHIRKELELIAVKDCFDLITKEHIDEMLKLVEKEKKAFEQKNVHGYIAANKEFHLSLARAGGNKFLIEFLSKILAQIDIYLLIYNAFNYLESHQSNSWEEHYALIDSLKAKDRKVFNEKLIEHLQFSLEELKIDSLNYQPLQELFDS